ncbi:hypothetical protein VHEMI04085 [[Torrubiella] hemipterigena]|uniref:NADPH-dependent 1-acyldihydroxyacetone phosphate reductase n=1 Tax=[Torrubiella] hemipterigena TaxID=1531966 RepID=A0A0A1TDA9_9HYPO|nr:hypothetical protein VHEMI04085 [[Torrubiella] hemipterigena]
MTNSKLKSVLITGCSQGGIGSSLALEFQKRGFHVFATARNVDKMAHLKDLANVTLLRVDVTETTLIKEAVDAVQKQTGGGLDFLVNNSGVVHVAPILDTDLQAAKDMFDVNVFGPLLMVQAFAPMLIASHGCIVNICSVSSYVYAPWMGLYGGSKAALEMMSETMRLELQPLGVRVLSIITGAVDTNIMNTVSPASIPDDSPYKVKSVEDALTKMVKATDGIKRTPADEFSKTVVSDVLHGATGRVWRGEKAGTVKFMAKFSPVSIIDRILCERAGMADLKV